MCYIHAIHADTALLVLASTSASTNCRIHAEAYVGVMSANIVLMLLGARVVWLLSFMLEPLAPIILRTMRNSSLFWHIADIGACQACCLRSDDLGHELHRGLSPENARSMTVSYTYVSLSHCMLRSDACSISFRSTSIPRRKRHVYFLASEQTSHEIQVMRCILIWLMC